MYILYNSIQYIKIYNYYTVLNLCTLNVFKDYFKEKRTTNRLSFRVQARIVYPFVNPLNSKEKGMHGVVIEKTSADGRGC